jgi:galactosamine-6-phosphate isomerase
MEVQQFSSYEALSEAAAEFVLQKLSGDGPKLFCAATGASPTGMYKAMVRRKNALDLDGLKILKLDEWYLLPMESEGTCESYLQQHLIQPLRIDPANYISFNSVAADPEIECERINQSLQVHGPIDICILGIGLNGHLALNEPAEELIPGIHLSELAETSKSHPMIDGSSVRPTHGFTLGIGDILKSRTIVLIINGPKKKTIFNQLMKEKVSTRLPASLLWLHPDVHCFYSDQT